MTLASVNGYTMSSAVMQSECVYLNSLTIAALSQHFSVDEIGGSEDPVCAVRHDTKRLRPSDVLPQGHR